jgi:CheY-like chemotaxis protein
MEGTSRSNLYEKINLKNARILAVDDSEETRDYFLHTMHALKLQCDVASGGHQAIQMALHAEDNPYSVYFIDWHMPHMDGIELTRKIKEINGNNSIVIMISANDWNAIEKEATEAGVDHFIPKPLFPSTLINAINVSMGAKLYESREDAQKVTSRHRYDFRNQTILVAEDIEINREIMSAVLEETGVSVEFAEDGRAAVSLFSASPKRYDLILMDINMPEMDGYEATRQIRALGLEEAKTIPIIAMTANVFKEDIEKCIEAGMNSHAGKPINANELFEKLDHFLRKQQG